MVIYLTQELPYLYLLYLRGNLIGWTMTRIWTRETRIDIQMLESINLIRMILVGIEIPFSHYFELYPNYLKY